VHQTHSNDEEQKRNQLHPRVYALQQAGSAADVLRRNNGFQYTAEAGDTFSEKVVTLQSEDSSLIGAFCFNVFFRLSQRPRSQVKVTIKMTPTNAERI